MCLRFQTQTNKKKETFKTQKTRTFKSKSIIRDASLCFQEFQN